MFFFVDSKNSFLVYDHYLFILHLETYMFFYINRLQTRICFNDQNEFVNLTVDNTHVKIQIIYLFYFVPFTNVLLIQFCNQ